AQVYLGPLVAGRAAPAHPDAVDRDVQPVGVEYRVGGADGGQHAPPVRVLAGDRALEQVAPGYRAADGHRVGFPGRTDDLHHDHLRRALGVQLELADQVRADFGQRPGEVPVVGLDA